MPAVTLDLWHTLLYLPPDEEEAYMRSQVAMATRVLADAPRLPGAPEVSEEELRKAFEREYARAVQEAEHGHTVTPAEQLLRSARAVGRAARAEPYLDALAEDVGHRPFATAPGVLPFLDALHSGGYRVGVISNTIGERGEFLRPVLRSTGLLDRIETFVFSDQHPWTKPNPEIFREALRRLGESPAQAVHVGDGWPDIEGARRAGYRGGILYTGLQEYGAKYKELFLRKDWDRPSADHVAKSLAEVLPLVRGLLAPRLAEPSRAGPRAGRP